MRNWLGSHWRWRVAMICIAATLICYGVWQDWRWKSRVLVMSGGSPAIYRVMHHGGMESIEAFDWKSGVYWTIATEEQIYPSFEPEDAIHVSGDGQTVLWRKGAHICVANIHPPHQLRLCKTPFERAEYRFVGASADARYAVFQAWAQRTVYGPTRTVVAITNGPTGADENFLLLEVVDLTTGEVVSQRQWHSTIKESSRAGEFESSIRGGVRKKDEPIRGRWKLSALGELELLESMPHPNSMEAIRTRNFAGWGLGAYEMDQWPGEKVPGLNRYWQNDDGGIVVCGDWFDDITVLDTATAKVIAKEGSGSGRRRHLLAVAIGLLLCAVFLMGIAFAEKQTRWGVFDALVATLLIQTAILPFHSSVDTYFARTSVARWLYLVPTFTLRGGLIGTAILIGWYWAHGRTWFAMRWLQGALWLGVMAAPVLVREARYGWETSLQVWVVIGLLIAGSTTMLAVCAWPLGWSIRVESDAPRTFSFGLLQLLMMIAAAAMALVIVPSFQEAAKFDVLYRSMSAILLGWPLVGVLFLRSRWLVAVGIILLPIAVYIASTFYIVAVYRQFGGTLVDIGLTEMASAVSAGLTILLPCIVLRCRGWGWTRLREADASKEAMA